MAVDWSAQSKSRTASPCRAKSAAMARPPLLAPSTETVASTLTDLLGGMGFYMSLFLRPGSVPFRAQSRELPGPQRKSPGRVARLKGGEAGVGAVGVAPART